MLERTGTQAGLWTAVEMSVACDAEKMQRQGNVPWGTFLANREGWKETERIAPRGAIQVGVMFHVKQLRRDAKGEIALRGAIPELGFGCWSVPRGAICGLAERGTMASALLYVEQCTANGNKLH
ncbi:hypothetical protein ACFPT7_00195 [Acidicapsa dinghuensis]|uniref:Uncharacterized protein n=1 Tax=Acidicapsa dinghuensis TaxID=2218256 RepID=A0ABW1E9H2_9BACT|nr:hypothetical protein [Acidicapsa dinghuensis]